jgi:hypothetical protein
LDIAKLVGNLAGSNLVADAANLPKGAPSNLLHHFGFGFGFCHDNFCGELAADGMDNFESQVKP